MHEECIIPDGELISGPHLPSQQGNKIILRFPHQYTHQIGVVTFWFITHDNINCACLSVTGSVCCSLSEFIVSWGHRLYRAQPEVGLIIRVATLKGLEASCPALRPCHMRGKGHTLHSDQYAREQGFEPNIAASVKLRARVACLSFITLH